MSKARDTTKRKEYLRRWQDKKKRFEKTRPYLMNFVNYNTRELKSLGIDVVNELNVVVVNLLGNNGRKVTKINRLSGEVGHELIDSIKCPDCGSVLYRHKYWDCFICEEYDENNILVNKKIFDIMELKCAKLDEHENKLQKERSIKIAKLRRGKR